MTITAEEFVERLRATFLESAEFDNFECDHGLTLGTCPESNNCLACKVKRLFDEHGGVVPGTSRGI